MDNKIKVYGVLQNYTTENILAHTDQLYDEALAEFLSDINNRLSNQLQSYITSTDITQSGTATNNSIKQLIYSEISTDGTNANSYIKNTIDWYIAGVVANAPASFDTLKEIADWIQNDSTDAAGLNSRIATNTQNIAAINNTLISLQSQIDNFDPDHNGFYTKGEIDQTFDSYYTKSEVDTLVLNVNSVLTDYYTKSEVDSLILNSTNMSNYYTKSQVDNTFGNYYTKSLVDALVLGVAPEDMDNYFTKLEIGEILTDYYTILSIDLKFALYYKKTEVDQLFEDANHSDTGDLSVDSITTSGDVEVGGELVAGVIDCHTIGIYMENGDEQAITITDNTVINGDLTVNGSISIPGVVNSLTVDNASIGLLNTTRISATDSVITPSIGYTVQDQLGLSERTINVSDIYNFFTSGINNYYTKSEVDGLLLNAGSGSGSAQIPSDLEVDSIKIGPALLLYNDPSGCIAISDCDGISMPNCLLECEDVQVANIKTTSLRMFGNEINGIDCDTLLPNESASLGSEDNRWSELHVSDLYVYGDTTCRHLEATEIYTSVGIYTNTISSVGGNNGNISINSNIITNSNNLSLGTYNNRWDKVHVNVASVYNHLEVDIINSVEQGGTVVFRDCNVTADNKLTVDGEIQTPILYTDSIYPNTSQDTVILVRGDMSANSILTLTIKYIDDGILVSVSLKDIKAAVDYVKSLLA